MDSYEQLDREACRLRELNAELVKALQLFVKYDDTADEDGVCIMLAYAEAIEAARAALTKAEA